MHPFAEFADGEGVVGANFEIVDPRWCAVQRDRDDGEGFIACCGRSRDRIDAAQRGADVVAGLQVLDDLPGSAGGNVERIVVVGGEKHARSRIGQQIRVIARRTNRIRAPVTVG